LALSSCQPKYQELPTWSRDLSEVRKFSDLPPEAAAFVELFEKELGVPVTRIGVGANREQVILR
jgi:adenylosuccinate synthase